MPRSFFSPKTADDLQVTIFNREYAAVHHLLTAPLIAQRTAPFILDDGFDWAGLEHASETMSGGEGLLVTIAYELWHAEKLVGLWELANRLDAENFRRVITALSIYRGATASAQLAELLRSHHDEDIAA